MSIEVRDTPKGRRYLVRWSEAGRKRSRTFGRRADATAWEREVQRRQQLGLLAVQQLTSSGPTLDDWIADRWTHEHGPTLAPATLASYAALYRVHVAPTLGHRPLRDLTVSVLREWQADLVSRGVGHAAIKRARALLSGVLRHAAESEVIVANPVSLVRAPKAPHKDEVVPIAPVGVERMRSALNDRDATLISVLAYAGVRPGEALALRWQHVGERTLTVFASKTGRRRSVRLLSPLAADLAAWRAASGRPARTALLFPGPDGERWSAEAYKSWARSASKATMRRGRRVTLQREAGPFHRARAAAGIEGASPYTLRHSFASLLLAEGRTVHYVAAQLGHGPDLTLKTYGHLFAEFDEAPRIDPEDEIRRARVTGVPLRSHSAVG